MAVTEKEYTEAIKKLLPKGVYWENLLNNPKGDLNTVLEEKASRLASYRQKTSDLTQEAFMNSFHKTIADYERVYLNTSNAHLSFEQRKSILSITKNRSINTATIQEIAKIYGGKVTRIDIPYTECFFGHNFFGDFIASPASENIIFIKADIPELARPDFEKAIESALLANQTIYFFYGE